MYIPVTHFINLLVVNCVAQYIIPRVQRLVVLLRAMQTVLLLYKLHYVFH